MVSRFIALFEQSVLWKARSWVSRHLHVGTSPIRKIDQQGGHLGSCDAPIAVNVRSWVCRTEEASRRHLVTSDIVGERSVRSQTRRSELG
jgi:hypothetical protein